MELKETPPDYRIFVKELSRESLEDGCEVREIINTALKKAPEVGSFKLVVIPAHVPANPSLVAALENLRARQEAEVKREAQSFDPYASGRALVQKLKEQEGGAWSASDMLTLFNLSAATLHKRRKEFRIIYWRDPQSRFFYPKWQFSHGGTLLRGIVEVLQIFRSSDEWRVLGYFLGPRKQFDGKRPLDLLREGQVAKVIAHARSHADENTW